MIYIKDKKEIKDRKEHVKNRTIFKYVLNIASDKATKIYDSIESDLEDWIEEILEYKGCIHNLDTYELKKNIDLKESWSKFDLPIDFQTDFIRKGKNNFTRFVSPDFMLIWDVLYDYYIEQLLKDDFALTFNHLTGNYIINGLEIEL